VMTVYLAGKQVFVAGKWQVAARNPLGSIDLQECSLLDTQEVTDSSSVEPTTSFSKLAALTRQLFGACPHGCPHRGSNAGGRSARAPPPARRPRRWDDWDMAR